MAFIPLQLPPGIERNNTPYDTPGRWWNMNQVRWSSGSMLPIGGWQRNTPAGSPLDTPVRAFHVWRNNVSARAVLIGTDAKLYVDDSGGYVDITPVGFVGPGAAGSGSGGYGTGDYGEEAYGVARSSPSPIYSPYGYWSFGDWGEDVIFTTNTDGNLWYYDQSAPTTDPVQITATAGATPTSVAAVLVTPERHVMTVGTNADPRSIGWSSSEDYGDWDFASTTNTAGTLPLKSRTPLLMSYNVAEGTLVMSYTDVFLIRYSGEPYIYQGTDPISDTSLFNPMSVATFGGKAAWPSRMGFQLYAGGFVQPLPCPVFNDIMTGADDSVRMDPTYGPFRFHGKHNFRFPEIWWFYPSVGNMECNRYVMWNYVENTWAWGELARSAMSSADAYQYPYMGSPDGHIWEHEFGWLANGATRVGQVWAETGALGFGPGDKTMDVKQLLIATGNGYDALTVTAYGKMAPEGTEYTVGPKSPRSDGYTDIRFSFRHSRLRFTNAKDGPFAVGALAADASPGTGR